MMGAFFRQSVLCLPVLVAAGLASAQQNQLENQNATGTFRIAGTVVNSVSGAPLARARVSIVDVSHSSNSLWMITAGDGRFAFQGVPAGKYSLQGARRGFVRSAYEEHEEYSTAIVTGAGVDTEQLVLRLPPLAKLSGKVLDETGDPVRNATLWLYRENRDAGVGRIVRYRPSTTDDLGAYDFAPLDAGTYFLSVQATPWYAIHPQSTGQQGGENSPAKVDPSLDVAYAVTYYADATDPDEATPIPISPGDHAQVDIHLNPVPALHVLVHAPESPERGFVSPMLSVTGLGGAEMSQSFEAQSSSPGNYEMVGVPPGRYTLRMRGAGQSGQDSEIDLTQNGQELEASKLRPVSTVKAKVQIAGEAGVPAHLALILRNSKLHAVAVDEVNEKGEIEFHDLGPGQYDVIARTPEKRYFVVHISSPANEVTGHMLTVPADSSAVFTLSLIKGTVDIQGLVKHAGKPAARAMVVLVPKDPEKNHDLFRRDQSDLDGSFKLADVIPASYTVCAIENGWDLDWARPGVIAHYCRHGKAVSIGAQNSGSLHLPDPVELQPK
jgi:sarcosine oxidase gamma subunit